ncbi:MAG: site-specific DNA-methyltransferase [Ardenticatenales bacterium]|nr:site-specific DNA-methyltransferase [Ardenticatenales bacterium]
MREDKFFKIDEVSIHNQDVLSLYAEWPCPDVIISDGGYGVSGFKGDAHEPARLRAWYKEHIAAWSTYARAGTTLWFWNTEIGWATVHPILDEQGWEYVGCNTWNKGIQHIAGNCNLPTLKGFPVVTEICVQYVKRPGFSVGDRTLTLKEWLRHEWERTGLPLYKTNEACGVANAASRKYFTKDHLWYAPLPEVFEKLVAYANVNGAERGRPYFSIDGISALSRESYTRLFAKFDGKYGVTNVWEHPPLHNGERIKVRGSSKYAHLNQKPLKLIKLLLEVSSNSGDVIWEPFGGLCTAGLAAYLLGRTACCAEIDKNIFHIAVGRLKEHSMPLFNIEPSRKTG